MVAYDSIISKICTQQLFHRSNNVQRSAILHEYCMIYSLKLLKCCKEWLCKSASYHLPVIVQVTGPACVIFSKKKKKKNGLTINAAIIPHDTVTFSDSRDNGSSWNGYLVAHILQFCVFTEPSKWQELRQTTEYSITICCPLPSWQEMVAQMIHDSMISRK